MKNKEEFKKSIFEKRDRYFARKRAERKRRLMSLVPVAAFMLIFSIVFLPQMTERNIPTEESYTESSGIEKRLLSVEVVRYPLAESSGEKGETYGSSESAKALENFLNSFCIDEHLDDMIESEDESYQLIHGYSITLRYTDRPNLSVVYLDNGQLDINGRTHTLTQAQTRQLLSLIDALK